MVLIIKRKLGVKKRAQTQVEPKSAQVKLEKGVGSQRLKPTCVKFGKKHYGECLLGTGTFFGCGKEGHKVIDCPVIASRRREVNKLLLVFQRTIIQKRGVSINSGIQGRSRIRGMMILVSSIYIFVI